MNNKDILQELLVISDYMKENNAIIGYGQINALIEKIKGCNLPHVSACFDYERVSTYEGHITVDAFNCVCGFKYVYYGILNKTERINFPRAKNTYLKHEFLKDVKCEKCKKLKYEQLAFIGFSGNLKE